MQSTLEKQISSEVFAIAQKIADSKNENISNYAVLKSDSEKQIVQCREYLHHEITNNRESIVCNFSDTRTQILGVSNELNLMKLSFINLLRQQDSRLQDLEQFATKKLEYHPRSYRINLDVEGP